VIGSANHLLLLRVITVILLNNVVTAKPVSFVTTTFVQKQKQQLKPHPPHRNALNLRKNVLVLPLLEEFAVLDQQLAASLLMLPTLLRGWCVQPRFPGEIHSIFLEYYVLMIKGKLEIIGCSL